MKSFQFGYVAAAKSPWNLRKLSLWFFFLVGFMKHNYAVAAVPRLQEAVT